MSVTYYWNPTHCPTCGHGETIEIGSHGVGWVFTLEAYEEKGLISWKAWKLYLLQGDGEIEACSGGSWPVSVAEFVEIVEGREGRGLESTADTHPGHYTRDPDGFTIERWQPSGLRCPTCTTMLHETASSPEHYYCPRCDSLVSESEAVKVNSSHWDDVVLAEGEPIVIEDLAVGTAAGAISIALQDATGGAQDRTDVVIYQGTTELKRYLDMTDGEIMAMFGLMRAERK